MGRRIIFKSSQCKTYENSFFYIVIEAKEYLHRLLFVPGKIW